ncbi:MAG: hypothetical protein QOI25_3007 [Mycobacterium sp.]|nr:hypothetical protein [Mycobacterium sp.]
MRRRVSAVRFRLRAGAWWSEFGAAKWGGGAADPLGVGRERWHDQLPDNGAGVARTAHGDAAGTRELIDVLLLHRHMRHGEVVAGLAVAVSVGASSADVVAVEARRHASRPNSDTSDQPAQWPHTDDPDARG